MKIKTAYGRNFNVINLNGQSLQVEAAMKQWRSTGTSSLRDDLPDPSGLLSVPLSPAAIARL